MEWGQIVIYIVLLSLTAVLVTVGYQLIRLIKLLQQISQKVNLLLDSALEISESVKQPFNSLSGFVAGLREGAQLINMLKSSRSKKRSKS